MTALFLARLRRLLWVLPVVPVTRWEYMLVRHCIRGTRDDLERLGAGDEARRMEDEGTVVVMGGEG